MNDNNKIIKNYDIYNTRTDIISPKRYSFTHIPALYDKNMLSHTWLRYNPSEPRWNDIMDTRTDC